MKIKDNFMLNLSKFLYLLDKNRLIKLPDELFLKVTFRVGMKKKLDLLNPQTFNEKLQWLKLNDRKDIYTKMVDKYEAKNYVASIIGEEYIIPTLGIYDSFDEIDFKKLPNQFVIKCTHDSGGLVIVKNKSTFDKIEAKKKINKCLKKNYYYSGREWPYKNVKPRIIIEKYMSNNNEELEDYKIHNFNGIPKVILVCKDRYKNTGLTEDFFDTDWKHLDIKRPYHDNSNSIINKPKKLNEILELSKKLSKNIPFVRTDFYIIEDKIYFGEITFYPSSGFSEFVPEKWDYELGSWLIINNSKKENLCIKK